MAHLNFTGLLIVALYYKIYDFTVFFLFRLFQNVANQF